VLDRSRTQASNQTPASGHLWVSWAAAISLAAAFGLAHFLAARLSLGPAISPDGAGAFWPAAGLAAAAVVVLISTCALIVAALFSERQSREALLRASNERLRKQQEAFCRLLGSLPAAIYTTDRSGRITYCNQAAVDLWGKRPELGKDKWSDLWRLHYPDGSSVPLDDRPTQIALNEGRAVRGRELLLERPDGTLVPVMPCPAPLLDERGTVIGVVNMQIDLTERRRAEAALAERDAQLDLAHKAARVGSYTYDFVAKTMRISRASAAIYGLSPSAVEITAEQWHARVHRDDMQRVRAEHIRALKQRQRELVCEFRYVQPGGAVRWIEARSLVAYDDSGRARRMTGVYIDVTERKQTEAVLRESESRLADALAAGQVIAFEWDAATRRSRRSANAALILGYEEGDSVGGSPCEDFFPCVHPDDRERFKAHIRELSPDNPSYALSFRFRSPGCRPLWLEEAGKGEFDAAGRLLRIKGLTRNITDRKNAERALDERNMQLSLAGKAALVGSFAVDFETDEVQVSEGYVAIHGLPEGTSRITRSIWRAGVHPQDLQRVDEIRSRVFRSQRREYGAEYRVTRSTGEERWIEARCFVSYSSDGLPARMVGVDIDVTERKRAEEHQRMLLAELDHRVKNVLATVSAVASRTQDTSCSGVDFVATLAGRIRSMAATHELLSCRQWKGVSLLELIRRELAPYMTGSNTHLDGPELMLVPEAAQALSMVLHELTTNAAKHGALAIDDGCVCVRWHRVPNGNWGARVRIEWREYAGPAVRPPERGGYGMEVIRGLIPYELDGAVDLVFAPQGVRCDIDIPVKGAPGEQPPARSVRAAPNALAASEIS
jgi:PAS domain S-box-containing protein